MEAGPVREQRGEQRAFDPEERIALLLRRLGTWREGLSDREAVRRLEQYGPNGIQRREGRGHLSEPGRQFTHTLELLLWAAAVLALVAGTTALAAVIVAVIFLNAVFAFVQELQAEKATEALRSYLPPRARVRRDGTTVEVDAPTLVSGDLLLLSEGDKLSVDARLIEGSVEVDVSPLTGESQPVVRSATRSRSASSPLESDDLVFSGTLVTAGEAESVVYTTGMGNQLGRIAALTQRVRGETSPLQRQVNRAAWLIAGVAVGAGVLFLIVGTTIARLPLGDALTFAVGLLVANVPEGLLPTITLALAVGVRRMARRRALLKRLTAVETLGSTDVICTDKTGTLTEGQMVVNRFWADGEELLPESRRSVEEPFSGLLRTAVRCSNAALRPAPEGWERSGDPSESALMAASPQSSRRSYIFVHATPEIVPFLIYALSGGTIPLPLTVMQILAIDLGTETLPALALGREAAEPGIMERPHLPRGRDIIDRPMLIRPWLWLGLVEAALVTGGFFYVLYSAGRASRDPLGPGSAVRRRSEEA